MTKKNRQVVSTFTYRGYTLDIYDTNAVEIHGRSETHPEQNFHKNHFSKTPSEHDNGCRLIMVIGKLGVEYNTGYLHKLIDIFDSFVKFNQLTVDGMAQKPRKMNYENEFDNEFLYNIIDRTDLTEITKWCIIASVLTHYNRLTRESYRDFLENTIQNQVEPEKYCPISLEMAEYYAMPFFLSKNANMNVKKEDEFKNVYAISALYAGAADNLEEAYKKGFVPLQREMNNNESQALSNSYRNLSDASQQSSLILDKQSFIAFYGVSFFSKLPKELIDFITQRILNKDFEFSDVEEPYKRFYLSVEEYKNFEKELDVSYSDTIFNRSSHIQDKKVVDWVYLMFLAYLFVMKEPETVFSRIVQEIETVFNKEDKPSNSYNYSWSWSSFSVDWKAQLIASKNKSLRDLVIEHMQTSIPMIYLANMNGIKL